MFISCTGNLCEVGGIPKIDICHCWDSTKDFTRHSAQPVNRYDFTVPKQRQFQLLYFFRSLSNHTIKAYLWAQSKFGPVMMFQYIQTSNNILAG